MIREDFFELTVAALISNTKAYEEKKIKHYQYSDAIESIFDRYAVNKKEFYKELNVRLGIKTNEVVVKGKKPIATKKKVKDAPFSK